MACQGVAKVTVVRPEAAGRAREKVTERVRGGGRVLGVRGLGIGIRLKIG